MTNGGNGTDHGRGNIKLIAGKISQPWQNVYGESVSLYSEVVKLNNKKIFNPDIDGRTEFDHIFGSTCDWVASGSSNSVFPNRNNALIETPGIFTTLFI